ncbi:rod-binding protein [Marivita sp.]|uniref:rod-binding protein n=1 Tax=Marivita sp. TaxID=2003365 RepID=UPI0025B8A8EC|nr:rod-binding protein [Marivita sp.]
MDPFLSLPRPAVPGSTGGPASDAHIAKVAEEFEAVFIATMLEGMLEAARPKTMGGGMGEQMFTSLMSTEIAKEIARSGGVGLARSVEAQIDAYRR